jgi:hypothetical protein
MKPRLIISLTFIIGLLLFFYSLSLPIYKDQKAADELLNNSDKIDKQEYYKRDAELRTSKTTFMDLGAGIAIASGTILFFLLLTKTKTFRDFKNLKTFNKLTLFISANLVWLFLIPGTFWYYTFRGARGDYPPFADSIAIPIFTQIPLLLFLLFPLNVFILLTTINTNLPTKLFVSADTYNRPAILWELFFGFWLLINLSCFVAFVADGDHISILVNLFFTYILMTLRAGQISKYKQTTYHASL